MRSELKCPKCESGLILKSESGDDPCLYECRDCQLIFRAKKSTKKWILWVHLISVFALVAFAATGYSGSAALFVIFAFLLVVSFAASISLEFWLRLIRKDPLIQI